MAAILWPISCRGNVAFIWKGGRVVAYALENAADEIVTDVLLPVLYLLWLDQETTRMKMTGKGK